MIEDLLLAQLKNAPGLLLLGYILKIVWGKYQDALQKIDDLHKAQTTFFSKFVPGPSESTEGEE